MDPHRWTEVMSAAFADMNAVLDAGKESAIDPYAAENPAEFFAVMSEVFFDDPVVLEEVYPDVYEQFCRFYRQDPAFLVPWEAGVD
jgi:hypothetical protein